MGRRGRAMIGGLLSGVGEGMMTQAEQRRQDALERARLLARKEEKADDRAFLTERDDVKDERSRGLLSQIDTDADGNRIGITAGLETVDLGYKAKPDKASKESVDAATKADQFLVDELKAAHTTKDVNGNERTDWATVTKKLKQRGRADLAAIYAPGEGGGGVDRDSADWRQAEADAEKWVDNQAGWTTSDKEDFKDYGGNRAEALRAKTIEFYRQYTGQGATGESPKAKPKGAAVQEGAKANAPEGAGTQVDPYRGTTQQHVDWFRENAPAGSVLQVGTKLYQK